MSTISPNMNLPISTVAVDSGLNWELNLNAALTLIDQHNHTAGMGVPIQPSGLDINADLPMNNNNLTLVRSTRFQPQSAALSDPADLGCLYESGTDLWYNDGAGNQIRITQGGSVAGSTGTITGLPSGTASASYSAGTFTWQAATNTGANMDFASAILRNNTASSKGLTLQPPNAMAVDYSLTLPTIPGVNSFLTIDTSGNMAAGPAINGGITGTNIAALTITAGNIVSGTITTTQINASAGILGSQLSASAGILGSQLSASANILGTQLTNDINLQGSIAQVNGRNIVVSAANAGNGLKIVVGSVDSGGTKINGLGFTSAKTGAATYRITFDSEFFETPGCSASVIGFDDYIYTSTTNVSFVDFTLHSGTASNFSFMVIGRNL